MDSHPEDLPQPIKPPIEKTLPGIRSCLTYPLNRGKFFHWRYTQNLIDDNMANRIGTSGCWLLTRIVYKEDELHYSRAPDYFNGQLMEYCGFSSDATLISARNKCIEYGLLHYEPSLKRKAGLYWVIVPPQWEKRAIWTTPENALQNLQGKSNETLGNPSGKIEPKLVTTNPIPIPNSEPSPTILAAGEEWKDLVERLKNLGLKKAEVTINDARRKGLTRSYITSVMDHYESLPGAWNNVGVIDWRLTTETVINLPPVEGWPDPKIAVISQAKVQRMIQTDRLKAKADAQSLAETKAREEQLLFAFKDQLSALTHEEIQRLADADANLKLALRTFGAGSRAFQVKVARHLAQVAEPSR